MTVFSRKPATAPAGKDATVNDVEDYLHWLAAALGLSWPVPPTANGDPRSGRVAVLVAYGREMRTAREQERRWRRTYYATRSAIIAVSALITVLSGLALSGTWAVGTRIAVLVLGALVTVGSSTLDLFHMLDRWRSYRSQWYELKGGALEAGRRSPEKAFELLSETLRQAVDDFEGGYAREIATDGASRTGSARWTPPADRGGETTTIGRPAPDRRAGRRGRSAG